MCSFLCRQEFSVLLFLFMRAILYFFMALLPTMVSGYTKGYNRYALYDHEFHSTDKYEIYSKWFDETRLASKTKDIQKMIWDHQNPKNCMGTTKYIVTKGFDVGGLGAEVTGIHKNELKTEELQVNSMIACRLMS